MSTPTGSHAFSNPGFEFGKAVSPLWPGGLCKASANEQLASFGSGTFPSPGGNLLKLSDVGQSNRSFRGSKVSDKTSSDSNPVSDKGFWSAGVPQRALSDVIPSRTPPSAAGTIDKDYSTSSSHQAAARQYGDRGGPSSDGSTLLLTAALQGILERLDAIEDGRLARIEARIDVLATGLPSEELGNILAALQATLSESSDRCSTEPKGIFGKSDALQPASMLPSTASSWGRAVATGAANALATLLSVVDSTAVGLARRLLIGNHPSTVEVVTPATSAADLSIQPSPTADVLRAGLGAALMVTAVESAANARWHLERSAPRRLTRALRPLRVGVSATRTVVWIGVTLLIAARTRAACLAAADLFVRCAMYHTHRDPGVPAWLPAWFQLSIPRDHNVIVKAEGSDAAIEPSDAISEQGSNGIGVHDDVILTAGATCVDSPATSVELHPADADVAEHNV